MRKLAIILVCCCASQAQADVPLLYEGFNYDAGLKLANPFDSTPGATNQGLQNPGSLKFWFPAGPGAMPTVADGNVYDINTGLPAPRTELPSNSVAITTGGGSVARIEIPGITAGAAKTVYWSTFLRVDTMGTLAGGPSVGGATGPSEAGVFLAGYNNTPGPQSGNPSVVGGLLAIKHASIIPDTPRFSQYYLGTSPNSVSNDCLGSANYACANRRFADYDASLDVPGDPTLYADLPNTYKTAGADTRSKFPAVPLNLGQTVFVVGVQEMVSGATNDTAKLWINPSPSTFGDAVPPTPNVSITSNGSAADLTDVRTFFFRDNTGNPDLAIFDELRIGLTWASVTDPSPPIVPTPGDYNADGHVNAADYVTWRNALGGDNALLNGNGNETPPSNGVVDQDDYAYWTEHFGNPSASSTALATTVPEPASLWLLVVAAGSALMGCRRLRS